MRMNILTIGCLIVTTASASASILDDCRYTAPRSVNASVAGVSRIVIIGRAGTLRVTGRAAAGEVRGTVAHVTGDVRIGAGSGSITVEPVGASVSIPSDNSGSVAIRDVKRNVALGSKGSGSVFASDVGSDFRVRQKGSGRVSYQRVAGH